MRGVGTGTSAKLLPGGLSFDQLADAGRLIGSKGAAVVEAWDQVLGWRDLIRMRTELDRPLLPPAAAAGRYLSLPRSSRSSGCGDSGDRVHPARRA